MAEPAANGAPHIQFDDSILPIPRKSDSLAIKDPGRLSIASEKRRDLDDEENAKRIAEEDINGSRKQVSAARLAGLPTLC